jgi:hypothetical protein
MGSAFVPMDGAGSSVKFHLELLRKERLDFRNTFSGLQMALIPI